MKTIIAVDPGVSGGLAIKQDDLIELHSMPETLSEMHRILADNRTKDSEIYIEDIPKFTGKNIPSSTTAVLFQSMGRLEGIAIALGYSLHRIPPKMWQEPLGLGKAKDCANSSEWKRKLKNKAAELYPTLEPTLKTADALLILHFATKGLR